MLRKFPAAPSLSRLWRPVLLACSILHLAIAPLSDAASFQRADQAGSTANCTVVDVAKNSGDAVGHCLDSLLPQHFQPSGRVAVPVPAGYFAGKVTAVSGDGGTLAGQIFTGLLETETASWTSSSAVAVDDVFPGLEFSDSGVVFLSDVGDRMAGTATLDPTPLGWVHPGIGFPNNYCLGGLLVDFVEEHYDALSPDGTAIARRQLCEDPSPPNIWYHEVIRSDGSRTTNPVPDTRAFSADASVWVGANAAGFAVRHDGTTLALGTLGVGDLSSVALDTSGDGSVVVGRVMTGTGPIAFIWDAQAGMRSLEDELSSLGIDVSGWVLEEAVAIDAAGTVIGGNGLNHAGKPEGFVVDLASTPVPASGVVGRLVLLALVTLGALATLRRFGLDLASTIRGEG